MNINVSSGKKHERTEQWIRMLGYRAWHEVGLPWTSVAQDVNCWEGVSYCTLVLSFLLLCSHILSRSWASDLDSASSINCRQSRKILWTSDVVICEIDSPRVRHTDVSHGHWLLQESVCVQGLPARIFLVSLTVQLYTVSLISGLGNSPRSWVAGLQGCSGEILYGKR